MNQTPNEDWSHLPRDPDMTRHLGYDLIEIDVIRTPSDSPRQLLFLPRDEDLLRDEAYLVAGLDSVRDLREMS